MYSLVVRGSSIGTKNFASLYVGVPMTGKIGLKDGSHLRQFYGPELNHT